MLSAVIKALPRKGKRLTILKLPPGRGRGAQAARKCLLRLSHSIEPMLVRTCISVATLGSFFKLVSELEEERISPRFGK
jgi:hypothetical protein